LGRDWNGKDKIVKHAALLLPLALAFAPYCATAATDAKTKAPPEAQIPFANHGGVWNWTEGDDDRTIYFEDRSRQWYKATLFAPAVDLPFSQGIRIDAGPGGTLDKWGAIYIGRQRYPFTSFEKVAGPPVRAKNAKADKAAKDAKDAPAKAN